jgi:hypothetical protein
MGVVEKVTEEASGYRSRVLRIPSRIHFGL